MDSFFANLILELEYDAGTDVLKNGRCSCLLKFFRVFNVLPLLFIDEKNGTSSNAMGA